MKAFYCEWSLLYVYSLNPSQYRADIGHFLRKGDSCLNRLWSYTLYYLYMRIAFILSMLAPWWKNQWNDDIHGRLNFRAKLLLPYPCWPWERRVWRQCRRCWWAQPRRRRGRRGRTHRTRQPSPAARYSPRYRHRSNNKTTVIKTKAVALVIAPDVVIDLLQKHV